MSKSARPVNPLQHPRFAGITTFSRLPYVPEITKNSTDLVVLGAPFDGGTTFRPGARFGPRAIREASVLCRNYNPHLQVNVYEKMRVVDGGDIQVNPLNLQATYKNIERHVGEVYRAGARPVILGGDHSIGLPLWRAAHKAHGDFTLIHFDAHTDTADQAWGEKYHHGTPIRRAIEEGILKGDRIFQIGIRGPLTVADQEQYSEDHGIHTLDIDAFQDPKKKAAFFSKIRKVAGKKPCYLTFDIDGIDPAYAPGTGTPVVGGLTSREALAAVRELKGLHFVCADMVEVAPAYDHSDITSLLAAALVFEFMSLMSIS